MLHKRWRDYSEKEIYEIQSTKCSKCKYGKRYFSVRIGHYKHHYCDFYSMTGQRRNCRPEDCTHCDE